MSKRIFIAFITILSLLWGFGIHETLVQAQGPPLIPPHGIWGVPSVDGVPLHQSDTGYTISVKMVQLLLIFLHELDDQGTIAAIVAELDIGTVTTLKQAFLDSEYCQSRTPPTELSPTATVTVQVAGDEWLVSDGGKTYTVKRIDIPVWDPILEDWIDGSRLEVYEHDGEIASYTMGELPVDYFVVQIPMNSAGILWGDIDGGDYFVLREAGTAMVGDEAFLCINDIPITNPSGPYVVTEDAFVSNTTMVEAPAARSLSIIISLRSYRSTMAPATGLSNSKGVTKKKPVSARAVAFSVPSYTHTVTAKPLMALPSRETTWPIQMTIKARIPIGRRLDVADMLIRSWSSMQLRLC